MKRASITEIREYPWFATDCPYYLFPDPEHNDSAALDLEAVKEVSNGSPIKSELLLGDFMVTGDQ